MQDHQPLELEHFLPYRLSILSNTVSAGIADEYQRRFLLSMAEWHVIAVLGRWRQLSAREVAERTAKDKVTVSRAVARLVKAGRVHRDTDDTDRRRSVLSLTDEGWVVHDTIAPLAREHESNITDQLTRDEFEALIRILDKLSPVSARGPL